MKPEEQQQQQQQEVHSVNAIVTTTTATSTTTSTTSTTTTTTTTTTTAGVASSSSSSSSSTIFNATHDQAYDNNNKSNNSGGIEDGHVFIVWGDLRRLACDTWLVPSSASPKSEVDWMKSSWFNADPAVTQAFQRSCIAVPTAENWRVFKVQNWDPDLPQPWIGNIEGKTVEWFVDGAREYLRAVAEDLRQTKQKPKNRRLKHLVALPIVGTGQGGGKKIYGDVLRQLLRVLYDAVREYKYDIALVTNSKAGFAAAQAERSVQHMNEAFEYALEPRLMRKAEALARLAIQGELVVFFGAGCSSAAGLPLWGELLHQLAVEAHVSESDFKWLNSLDYMDRARIIESRMAQVGKNMKHEVARLCTGKFYALSHAMLAALPVKEFVTTNYDPLFELASRGTGESVSVLPYEHRTASSDEEDDYHNYSDRSPICARGGAGDGGGGGGGGAGSNSNIPVGVGMPRGQSLFSQPEFIRRSALRKMRKQKRWLLKMHGCVTCPDDMVLTREDYIRYNEKKQALAGIVQALLITRHMLFVGFSLTDENFYSIVYTVKKALNLNSDSSSTNTGCAPPHHQPHHAQQQQQQQKQPHQQNHRRKRFGTALTLVKNPLVEELWKDEINTIVMQSDDHDPLPSAASSSSSSSSDQSLIHARSSRRVEIFLDYMVARSFTAATHLLDPNFTGVLTPPEKQFRDMLYKFVREVPEEVRRSVSAYNFFEQMLWNMGSDGSESMMRRMRRHMRGAKHSSDSSCTSSSESDNENGDNDDDDDDDDYETSEDDYAELADATSKSRKHKKKKHTKKKHKRRRLHRHRQQEQEQQQTAATQ